MSTGIPIVNKPEQVLLLWSLCSGKTSLSGLVLCRACVITSKEGARDDIKCYTYAISFNF